MNDFLEMVVPALTISFIFVVVFGFAGYMRYLRYKETIALAERGLIRPQRSRGGRNNMKIGVLLLVVGGAFACSLVTIGIAADEPEPAVIGVIFGILPASLGFGLILVDRINKRDQERQQKDEVAFEVELDEEDPIPPHKG